MDNATTVILAGLAGVLFHCLLKLNSLLQDARAANVKFSALEDYWKRDFVSILLSFVSVGIWYLVFGEVGSKYKSIQEFKVTSFVVMGMIGSYVIQLVMSRAKKKIRSVIDVKANVSDAAIGESQTKSEVVANAAEKGIDASKPQI